MFLQIKIGFPFPFFFGFPFILLLNKVVILLFKKIIITSPHKGRGPEQMQAAAILGNRGDMKVIYGAIVS